MFLIKTWNCHTSSKSTGLQTLSSVESTEQIQRGKQNRLFFSPPRAFVLQEGTDYVRTIPNPFNVFMCTKRVGNLDFQPVAQNQLIVRNKKVNLSQNSNLGHFRQLLLLWNRFLSNYINLLFFVLFDCLCCRAPNYLLNQYRLSTFKSIVGRGWEWKGSVVMKAPVIPRELPGTLGSRKHLILIKTEGSGSKE